MNLIHEIENLHRYGDLQQVHGQDAHATQSAGGLEVQIPVAIHPFKGGADAITEKPLGHHVEGQHLEVAEEYDQAMRRHHHIKIRQPMPKSQSDQVLAQLKERGLKNIHWQEPGTYTKPQKKRARELKPGQVSDN